MILDDGTIHPMTPDRQGCGLSFDSVKEARRWLELVELQRQGRISHLVRQRAARIRCMVPDVSGAEVCAFVYNPDFAYWEGGVRVIEDVKSPMTKKQPVYVLKKRLLLIRYGVVIRET